MTGQKLHGVFPLELSSFAQTILHNKRYSHLAGELGGDGRLPDYELGGNREGWPDVARRVARAVLGPYLPHLVERCEAFIRNRQLMPGGRYLYAAGRKFPQISNCFLMSCMEDSRQEWGRVSDASINALMTGGGVGIVYSRLRNEGALVKGMGGTSTGPLALMQMVNENARYIMQGGSRRSALWAGIHWWHPDVMKFIRIKDWDPYTREGKRRDFNFPASMDGTNISVILDSYFFQAYGNPNYRHELRWGGQTLTLNHALAQAVYWSCITSMCATGEPGLSVDIDGHDLECLRNACCEAVSDRDGDNCNLASINLPRIRDRQEMQDVVEVGTAFLVCGTLYGVLPVPHMQSVREEYRRIGLGVMGVHEWLLRRNKRYGPDAELGALLEPYADNLDIAHDYSRRLGIANSIAGRSVAPNGTIGIVGDTTPGSDPLYAAAYKRRYLEGKNWKYQYVVDRLAAQLVSEGVDPDSIEDTVTLAEDVERRIAMQAWLQQFVDQGISSTVNLPPWGSAHNNPEKAEQFGKTLLNYLPRLRGITVYPDGARDGQPLTRVPYRTAAAQAGVVFEEQGELACRSGVCGS